MPRARRSPCRPRTPRPKAPRRTTPSGCSPTGPRPYAPGSRSTRTPSGRWSRICRALDGTPLAIELAAARLRALTPAQVADRLGDRFRLLTVGSRTALPRHQTLRAVVDWSWELLDEAERRVLRRLSVFNGGATPDSAEEVLGEDVIDVIASLVDKSLVMATGNAEVRYRLLETVRAYAAERLAEAGEDEAAAETPTRPTSSTSPNAPSRSCAGTTSSTGPSG